MNTQLFSLFAEGDEMRDKKLQKQKRKLLFSGEEDLRARVEYLIARRSQGVVTTDQLRLAAYLGDEAAHLLLDHRLLLPGPRRAWFSWWLHWLREWKEAPLRASIVSCLIASEIYKKENPNDPRLYSALETSISCLYNTHDVESLQEICQRTAHHMDHASSDASSKMLFASENAVYSFHMLFKTMAEFGTQKIWVSSVCWHTANALIGTRTIAMPTNEEDPKVYKTAVFLKRAISDSLLPWALGLYDPLEKYRPPDKS